MWGKVVLGIGVIAIAVVSFFAGVQVQRRYPALFSPEPAPPALTSPESGAVLSNRDYKKGPSFVWEFSWSEVQGAERYQLSIFSPAFQELTYEVHEPRYRLAWTNLGFLPETQENWTWKVRVLDGGRWSNWSEVRTFRLEPIRE